MQITQPKCAFCAVHQPVCLLSSGLGDTLFCRECGGVQNANPRQAPVYSKHYYLGHYASIEDQQFDRFKNILQSVAPFVREPRLLDIGCGTGLLLKAAYEAGYRKCVGMDVDGDAVQIAREKLSGTDVTVQTSELKVSGTFGVITFMDSIGHIEKMEQTVGAIIEEHLAPAGLLIIKTPHHSRSYFRYGKVLGQLLGFAGKSGAVSSGVFFLPNRYYLFTESAMERFLARHGFKIVRRSVEDEYQRGVSGSSGFKDTVFNLLFRGIPSAFWGRKTMIVVACKE